MLLMLSIGSLSPFSSFKSPTFSLFIMGFQITRHFCDKAPAQMASPDLSFFCTLHSFTSLKKRFEKVWV